MIITIVGANRGIGLALATESKKRGDSVIAACRSSSKELDVLGVGVVPGVDVADENAPKVLIDALGKRSPDALIVAAGVLVRVGLDDLSTEEIRREFEVNALGPLRIAAAASKIMQKGSKIAFLTSQMGSIDDNTSGSHYAYRMSKAALNMAGRSLAHDLRNSGIAVLLIHPGFVKTAMTGGRGNVTTEESAKNILARVDALSLDGSGTFVHANGNPLPW